MSSTMLKIGQVHALLRRDAPDLELSKIRYYEDKGLVQPSRSKKGYRLYSERDVACLREAIRLADEEFVPLRVIRLRLIDQGLLDGAVAAKVVTKQAARAAAQSVVSLEAPQPEPASPSVPRLRVVKPEVQSPSLQDVPETMSLAELLQRSGLEAESLNKLIALGVIVPGTHGRDQFVRASDLAVARAAGPLLREGADPRLLGALRRVVEREIGVLGDLTAAVRANAARDPQASQRAVQATAGELAELRDALYERALGEFFSH